MKPHERISCAELRFVRQRGRKQLLEAYKEAYKKNQEWIKAVEDYLK